MALTKNNTYFLHAIIFNQRVHNNGFKIVNVFKSKPGTKKVSFFCQNYTGTKVICMVQEMERTRIQRISYSSQPIS